ncbi:MAG: MBL fold metallo-hydrolase [Haloarculaceae archaeon]
MEVRFLGGAGEIGRSAVLLDDSLLLDYGMASSTPPQYPVGDVAPDAVVVSHGHLDHGGAIPALLSGDDRPTVHWTPPTRDLVRTLAEDTLRLQGNTPQCPFTRTDLQRLGQVSETHGYGDSFTAAGYEVTLLDAGHIPGSAHLHVSDGETRLLYTGDFHTADQRLVAGTTARPDADVVVTESTYADVSHTPRDRLEREFVERLRETVWGGGTAVVPAFAVGRTQEIMLVCAAHDVGCYVDGMGTRVTDLLLENPEFLRHADALRRARSHARILGGRGGPRGGGLGSGSGGSLGPGSSARSVSREERERIAEGNTVVITTAGMLSGGPAMTYVPAISDHPGNFVALTGYQVEGTPGRDLLETGSAELDGRRVPVAARVEQFDFSAHADREGLRSVVDDYPDSRLLVVHGDDCEGYAARLRRDGLDARAPAIGDRLTV